MSMGKMLFAALVLTNLLSGCSSGRSVLPTVEAFPTSPPARHLLTPQQIAVMVKNDDQHGMRAHGWDILADLTSSRPHAAGDGNSPYEADWDLARWENKCTLGLGGTTAACGKIYPPDGAPCPTTSQKMLDTPPMLETGIQQLPEGVLKEPLRKARFAPSSGAAHAPWNFVSSVRYNPEAAYFIRNNCLNDLTNILNPRHVPLSPRAVIVKLMWAVPPKAGGPVNVWNPQLAAVRTEDPGKPLSWPMIWVDPGVSGPCRAGYGTFQSIEKGERAPQAATVPLECFYHRVYPCSFLKPVKPSSSGVVSGCKPGQKTFQALLMGVHIITGEQEDWVWSTYWWTPNPPKDHFWERETPVKGRGPWGFFAMNITMDQGLPRVAGQINRATFNPYIEGKSKNYTSSNCMFCHHLAVIHDPAHLIPIGQELDAGTPHQECYSPAVAKPVGFGASYWLGATSTHMLWSVATNQDNRGNSHPAHGPAQCP